MRRKGVLATSKKTHTQATNTFVNTYKHLRRDSAKHVREEAVRLRTARVKLQEEVRGLGPV